ncbi:MAG: sigma-70 family RNA polymerase sigma factor [Ruminococcus sp.]|nr:sigma-70 family RNA polymerase sigma factor [Ruminococcus sp.]
MDKHGNRLLRLAYSYLHNMQDSEEILQDVLMKLMDKAPVFESEEHEKAWLLRVTANLSKNRIEYNKLRDTDELKDELVAEERQNLSFVWEAVKELPENYREVIHLFYEEGYQTDEIADILGESGANIRTRLKRARAKLKEILKEEYDFCEQV